MLSLEGSGYLTQDSISVSNGMFYFSSIFKQRGIPYQPGTYTFEISTLTAKCTARASAQEIIGENG